MKRARRGAVWAVLGVPPVAAGPQGPAPYPAAREPLEVRVTDTVGSLTERWAACGGPRVECAELSDLSVGSLSDHIVPAGEANGFAEALLAAHSVFLCEPPPGSSGVDLGMYRWADPFARMPEAREHRRVRAEHLGALRDHPALLVELSLRCPGRAHEVAGDLGARALCGVVARDADTLVLTGLGRQVAGCAWVVAERDGTAVVRGDADLPSPRGGIDLALRERWSVVDLLTEYARLTDAAIVVDPGLRPLVADREADVARNRYEAEAVPTLVASALEPLELVLVPMRTTPPALYRLASQDDVAWETGVDLEHTRVEQYADRAATRVRTVVPAPLGRAARLAQKLREKVGVDDVTRIASVGSGAVVLTGTGAEVVLWSRKLLSLIMWEVELPTLGYADD